MKSIIAGIKNCRYSHSPDYILCKTAPKRWTLSVTGSNVGTGCPEAPSFLIPWNSPGDWLQRSYDL